MGGVAASLMEQEIFLVPYDPAWPSRFLEEEALLRKTIASFIVDGIAHIGSTAIPGMPAKPVIDVMVGVETLDASRPAIEILTDAGYCYFPYRGDVMHWFCKPSPQFRTHHLHLVPFESPLWKERLKFRDYLRSHPDAFNEYAALKQELAAKYRYDREAYTDQKGPFIQRILSL
jgi:GrpB-like predicted nucleotidyltransferase (UPF0157 family)